MNRCSTFLLPTFAVLSLCACGSLYKNDNARFHNHGKDYHQVELTENIRIPEGLDRPNYTPIYPVADVQAVDEFGDSIPAAAVPVPRPDSSFNDQNAFGIKIQSLGDRQWIAVGGPANQAWPRVLNYLAVNDLPLVHSNAKSGVIETDWLQLNDQQGQLVRFRILIEKGVHPDTSEIHITEVNAAMTPEGRAPAFKPWPSVSEDAEREKWFSKQIAESLAASTSNFSTSLLGQDVGGPVKVSFVKGAPEPTLQVRLAPQRAWASVRRALDKDGFNTVDASQTRGLVLVDYDIDHGKKKGLIRRLTSGKSSAPLGKGDVKIEKLIKHMSGQREVRDAFEGIDGVEFGDALRGVRSGYFVVFDFEDELATLVLRDYRGRRVPLETSKALMRVLRKNMI